MCWWLAALLPTAPRLARCHRLIYIKTDRDERNDLCFGDDIHTYPNFYNFTSINDFGEDLTYSHSWKYTSMDG